MRFGFFAAPLAICAFVALSTYAQADDSVAFAYQGRVRVQGQPFNGSGQFKFAIIDTSQTTVLWSHDGTGDLENGPASGVTLNVEDGIFSVVVGDTTVTPNPINATIFNSQTPLKLRVWFNDGVRGFQKLNPDHNLVNLALNVLETGLDDFTIYVDDATGDDADNGLTPATAKKTIQAAVDTLPERIRCNVIVDVAPGTYREQVSVFGITVIPGKQFLIRGDETWTPASGGAPSVILNGYQTGDSGTKAIEYGIYGMSSGEITLEGIHTKGHLNHGFRLDNGVYVINNCVAKTAGIGFVAAQNCFAKFTNCISDNNVNSGFTVSNICKAAMTSCSATLNGTEGLNIYNDSSVQLYGTATFDSNGQKQINLGNRGMLAPFGAVTVYVKNSNAGATWGIFNGWESVVLEYERFIFSGNNAPDYQSYVGGRGYYSAGATVPALVN